MINLKTSRKTPTINVKVDPVTNIHVAHSAAANSDGNVAATADVVTRSAPPVDVPPDVNTDELSSLQRENQVLKLVIDILHSNPLIINKYAPAPGCAMQYCTVLSSIGHAAFESASHSTLTS